MQPTDPLHINNNCGVPQGVDVTAASSPSNVQSITVPTTGIDIPFSAQPVPGFAASLIVIPGSEDKTQLSITQTGDPRLDQLTFIGNDTSCTLNPGQDGSVTIKNACSAIAGAVLIEFTFDSIPYPGRMLVSFALGFGMTKTVFFNGLDTTLTARISIGTDSPGPVMFSIRGLSALNLVLQPDPTTGQCDIASLATRPGGFVVVPIQNTSSTVTLPVLVSQGGRDFVLFVAPSSVVRMAIALSALAQFRVSRGTVTVDPRRRSLVILSNCSGAWAPSLRTF